MDNRRVYRTIRMAIKQLYPTEPKGNLARRLTNIGRAGGGNSTGQELSIASHRT